MYANNCKLQYDNYKQGWDQKFAWSHMKHISLVNSSVKLIFCFSGPSLGCEQALVPARKHQPQSYCLWNGFSISFEFWWNLTDSKFWKLETTDSQTHKCLWQDPSGRRRPTRWSLLQTHFPRSILTTVKTHSLWCDPLWQVGFTTLIIFFPKMLDLKLKIVSCRKPLSMW